MNGGLPLTHPRARAQTLSPTRLRRADTAALHKDSKTSTRTRTPSRNEAIGLKSSWRRTT
eukprot:8543938-Lingulodinium_polyedra.AAC.1